jgi:hypothetical protein
LPNIFQPGKAGFKEFGDAVLMDTSVFGAEVKVPLVPLGEDVHDVVPFRFLGWWRMKFGFTNDSIKSSDFCKISVSVRGRPSSLKTIGYLRVGTMNQEVQNQKLEILDYANKNGMKVNDFISVEISSRKTMKERRIDELMDRLNAGDTLIVSELSRLGRSLGEIIQIVDHLIKKQIRLLRSNRIC